MLHHTQGERGKEDGEKKPTVTRGRGSKSVEKKCYTLFEWPFSSGTTILLTNVNPIPNL